MDINLSTIFTCWLSLNFITDWKGRRYLPVQKNPQTEKSIWGFEL